eukprot:gene2664-3075_t
MSIRASLNKLATNHWFLVGLSMCGGLIFGYNTGIIAGALKPLTDQFDIGTIAQGLVVCSILLGALIGSAAGGVVADKVGRKPVVLFTCIATVAGAIASSAVTSIIAIALLRIILGLGVGCASSVCPLMVAETVPKEKRAFCGSFFQISITVGILIANVIGLVLKRSPNNWRWMFAIGAIPGVMLFLCFLFMNESPVYLQMMKDKRTKRVDHSIAEQSPFKLLMARQNRKPLFLGFILAVFAQLTGINAFMYFSTTIFKDAGIEGRDGPEIAAVVLQIWNVATTLIAIGLVDRVGRKKLLFSGSAVMTVCDLIIALFFLVLHGTAKGWASIVFLFIFVGAFEASIGTLFWFVINEIMPPNVKNIGAPIINSLQWFFNLILSFVFLTVVKYLGQSTMFWIFGGVGVVCTICLYLFLPDLKGVHADEETSAMDVQTPTGDDDLKMDKMGDPVTNPADEDLGKCEA